MWLRWKILKAEKVMGDLTQKGPWVRHPELPNIYVLKDYEPLYRAYQYYSNLLERQAEKWGIDPPKGSEFYDIHDSDQMTLKWLNHKGRVVLSRHVRSARLAYWKGWAEILVPILSLVVAILALLKT